MAKIRVLMGKTPFKQEHGLKSVFFLISYVEKKWMRCGLPSLNVVVPRMIATQWKVK